MKLINHNCSKCFNCNKNYICQLCKKKIQINEENIINLFKEIAKEEFGLEVKVPIIFNNKLRTTLGLYNCRYRFEDNVYVEEVIKFEFNPVILEMGFLEILDTLRHELVHWYTGLYGNGVNGWKHSYLFIENCKKFNVYYQIYLDELEEKEYIKKNTPKKRRLKKDEYYQVKCLKCNKLILESKNLSNIRKFCNGYTGIQCTCGSKNSYLETNEFREEFNSVEPYKLSSRKFLEERFKFRFYI